MCPAAWAWLCPLSGGGGGPPLSGASFLSSVWGTEVVSGAFSGVFSQSGFSLRGWARGADTLLRLRTLASRGCSPHLAARAGGALTLQRVSPGEDQRGPQGHPERLPAPDGPAQQQVRAACQPRGPSPELPAAARSGLVQPPTGETEALPLLAPLLPGKARRCPPRLGSVPGSGPRQPLRWCRVPRPP